MNSSEITGPSVGIEEEPLSRTDTPVGAPVKFVVEQVEDSAPTPTPTPSSNRTRGGDLSTSIWNTKRVLALVEVPVEQVEDSAQLPIAIPPPAQNSKASRKSKGAAKKLASATAPSTTLAYTTLASTAPACTTPTSLPPVAVKSSSSAAPKDSGSSENQVQIDLELEQQKGLMAAQLETFSKMKREEDSKYLPFKAKSSVIITPQTKKRSNGKRGSKTG